MPRDSNRFMRGALLASAVFNLGGAVLFAFPDSVGQFWGMPIPVPRVYTTLLAVFVMLFGGAYAWIARQPIIDRPLVALSAIGKTGVFAVILAYWMLGSLPGRGVLGAAPDLVLAAIFARWLVKTRTIESLSSRETR